MITQTQYQFPSITDTIDLKDHANAIAQVVAKKMTEKNSQTFEVMETETMVEKWDTSQTIHFSLSMNGNDWEGGCYSIRSQDDLLIVHNDSYGSRYDGNIGFLQINEKGEWKFYANQYASN
jgi:hypothetical protein